MKSVKSHALNVIKPHISVYALDVNFGTIVAQSIIGKLAARSWHISIGKVCPVSVIVHSTALKLQNDILIKQVQQSNADNHCTKMK